jgi:hypothetical protein
VFEKYKNFSKSIYSFEKYQDILKNIEMMKKIYFFQNAHLKNIYFYCVPITCVLFLEESKYIEIFSIYFDKKKQFFIKTLQN